jgi:hypothetical protein
MASCVYRNGQKGKRACPALGGMICPSCCGKHRLGEIACPADCRWLGGLAVVREGGGAFTREEYRAAVDRLHAFVRSPREVPWATAAIVLLREGVMGEWLGRGEVPEWALSVFEGFLAYGYRDDDGKRAVDRLVAASGRALPPGEMGALLALAAARASLFEIDAVRIGAGLTLRDRLLGDRPRVEVQEITASTQLRRGDVIFAWVMPVGEHMELTGASVVMPPAHLEAVEAALRGALEHRRREVPDVDPAAWIGAIADVALEALAEEMASWRPPTLVTADGEPLLFCNAHYTVTDEAAARARLAARDDMEENEGKGDSERVITWLGGGTTVLGGCGSAMAS